MSKIDRYKALIRYIVNLGVAESQAEIGQKVGYNNPSAFSQVINGKTKEPKQFMFRFLQLVPELNINWLEKGEGDMLLPASAPSIVTGDISGNGNNVVAGNGNHVTNTPSKDQPEEVPIEETLILDADIVRAPNYDIVEKFKDGTLDAEVKPTQYIVPDHTMKVYTDCDDMAPVVCAGEPVLIKVLPKDVPILHGRMYFVDLPAGAVIRYVFEEGENLILKAANAAYKDIVVPRAEVLSVSMVVLIMKRPTAMPNDRLSFMAELDRRNAQVDNLIEQIDKAGDRESKLIEQQTRIIEIIEKRNQ